jgi:putative hydrolase of the HAD superfamily
VIRAVFFDWFNTLARYEPPREQLHSQLLHEFGIEISPADLMPGLLAADKYFFDEIAHSSVDKRSSEEQAELYIRYANIMLSKVGIKADKELILQIIKKWPQMFKQAHFVLFDDVLATMQTLKQRNLVLGLLTNLTKGVDSICQELGLEPYLDFIVNPDEVGADKPKPAIFLAALERAGVNASEAVHIGDQYKIDVVGARGVGISPILIDRYDLYPEVTDCPRIRSLTELVDCL